MSTRKEQLSQIIDDLEEYVATFCPCGDDGKSTDLSGDKCNEAFLMLREAMSALSS
jgi:hypothetical protein